MTIPLWMLLGFATWTLLLLMATVGVYRWVIILFSKAPIASFRSDQLEGEDWYRRGTQGTRKLRGKPAGLRRHRLRDFGPRPRGPMVDTCLCILIARVCQSLVHVSHVQTDAFVAVRFSFYSVQLVCFLALIVIAAVHGGEMALDFDPLFAFVLTTDGIGIDPHTL